MKKIRVIAAFAAFLMLAGCAPLSDVHNPGDVFLTSNVSPEPVEASDFSRTDVLTPSISGFGYKLADKIAAQQDTFVLSPLSVYLALACLSNGAEGEAATQLKGALVPEGMDEQSFNQACGELIAFLRSDESPTADIASLICADMDYILNLDFAEKAKKYFNADTASADFSNPKATQMLNEWGEKATHGLIPQLFSQNVDPDTALILANSIYFSGKWRWEYGDSEDGVFHGKAGDETVPFMAHDGFQYYYENERYQALRQYYEGGACMDVYLPKDGVSTSEVLKAPFEGEPDFIEREGLFKMPKFTLDSEHKLVEILKSLGLNAIFEGGLTQLVTNAQNDLLVSDAFQKARIEVDEKGTKAAAVTVIAAAEGASLPDEQAPFEMVADRPFVFAINYCGQILFTGVISDIPVSAA